MKENHVSGMIDYYATFPERWEREYANQTQNETVMTSVRMAKYLNENKTDNSKILDAGCGTGFFGANLNKNNNELTGVDSSTAMISYAKDRNYDKIIVSDLIKYFKNCKSTYDVVVASDVMMIYPDYSNEPIFWGANKVLKTNGLFIFNGNFGKHQTKKEQEDRLNTLRERSQKYGFKIIEEFSGPAYIDDVTHGKAMTHIYVSKKFRS